MKLALPDRHREAEQRAERLQPSSANVLDNALADQLLNAAMHNGLSRTETVLLLLVRNRVLSRYRAALRGEGSNNKTTALLAFR